MGNMRTLPVFGPHITLGLVVQQISWHKYDFIGMLLLALVFFACSIAILVGAAQGRHYSLVLCSICSANIALVLYAAARLATTMHRREQALKGLPGPKHPLIFGMMVDLVCRRDPHRYATELAERYGPIFKFRLLIFHAVCITDPVLATQVLQSKVVDKLRFPYSFLDPFLGGENMLTGHTDAHWRAVRKAVAPAFSAGNMRYALGHIIDRSLALVEYLRKKGPKAVHNMDTLLLRESMDVIGRFGFQREMNALETLKTGQDSEDAANVAALLQSTHEIELRTQQVNRWFRLWRRDVRDGWLTLGRFRSIVWKLLEHIKAHPPQKGSFADLLLKARSPRTGRPLPDHLMFPEIAALFFAGIDTTGHTGTFILYLISQHPEVEQKILAELDSLELLRSSTRVKPRELTYADLSKLTYLNAVIKEALRMYPPVAIGQMRVSYSHDIVLGGQLSVPAGTVLWVPHHAMQNVSFNWNEPEKFLPERWLTPGTEYAVPEKLPLPREWYKGWDLSSPAAPGGAASGLTEADMGDSSSKRPKRYFPFAEGPRNCIGQSLAKVSLVATMATLLQHFSFRLADEMGGPEGVRAAEQYTLVVGLANGMLMHAAPRHDDRDDSPLRANGHAFRSTHPNHWDAWTA